MPIRIVRVVAAIAILLIAGPLAQASASNAPASPVVATPVAQPSLPVTITDGTGAEVTVEDTSRIVPLSGDIAEILWRLGLGDSIVGTDVSAVYPGEVMDSLPKIGFERNLSPEGILSLEPTLVIGNSTAGPAETLDQVRAAGVTVVIIDTPTTLDGVIEKINAVGEAVGLPQEADAVAASTQADIDRAQDLVASAASSPRVAFVYVREGGIQMLGGQGSGADGLIAAAGGTDVGVDIGVQGFIPVTPEAMAEANPEYILVPESGLASVGGMDELLDIPGIAETQAAKDGNVLVYEDLLFLGLTPRVGQMLEELVYAIHPELEQQESGG